MISSLVTRTSAALLLVCGLALLFAPDVLLPRIVPGFPPTALWLGQLLAAAWIGVATLNWSHRSAVLGGIYGRPVVFANAVLFLVSALGMVKALQAPNASGTLWFFAVPAIVLATVYFALLFRGPFDQVGSA